MNPQMVDSRFVLAVQNLRVSTDFYMDILGFERDFGDESDGWSFLSRDTVRLMIGDLQRMDKVFMAKEGERQAQAVFGK